MKKGHRLKLLPVFHSAEELASFLLIFVRIESRVLASPGAPSRISARLVFRDISFSLENRLKTQIDILKYFLFVPETLNPGPHSILHLKTPLVSSGPPQGRLYRGKPCSQFAHF